VVLDEATSSNGVNAVLKARSVPRAKAHVARLKQAVATLLCIGYDNSRRLYYKTRRTCKRPLVHWYKKHSSFTFLCKMRLVHWYSFSGHQFYGPFN